MQKIRIFTSAIAIVILLVTMLSGCGTNSQATQTNETLAEARQKFQTKITKEQVDNYSTPTPPEGVFETIQFESQVGKLDAYITPSPNDGEKHPAIIWIAGGWSNSIDSNSWELASMDNDQSARAFRHAGIVTMYPSRRGGNQNSNSMECWYGEIDDILSAYDYVSKLEYVDPNRIYLGGHSTGGSQAILAAELSDKFRAIFSFGPTGSVKYSDPSNFTFDAKNEEEIRLRSPLLWLNSITTPTYIFEGEQGNSDFINDYVKEAKNLSKEDFIEGYVIKGADHFNILAPLTQLVAQKILADTGEKVNIKFTESELQSAMKEPKILTKDFISEDKSYQISLTSDWKIIESQGSDSISFESLDGYYYFQISRFATSDYKDFNDFTTDVIGYFSEEGGETYTDIEDLNIGSAKAAKQLKMKFEYEGDFLIFCITFIQTDNAFYLTTAEAFEESFIQLENELSDISLSFKENK